MKNFIEIFLNLFRHHKLKIFAAILAFFVFLVLLFPFDDLGDMLTGIVAQQTGNQVFITADHLGISLFPQPALKAEGATIEIMSAPGFPALKADTVKAGISIPMLLSFSIGFHLQAHGLFDGSVTTSVPKALLEEIQNTVPAKDAKKYTADLEIEDIATEELVELFKLMVPIDTRLSAETSLEVDPSFSEQPTGDVDVSTEKAIIKAFSIPTPIGPVQIPAIQLSSIKIDGYLKNGKFSIESATIGERSDDIFASIKGQIDMAIKKSRGRIDSNLGAYEFTVELQAKPKILRDIPYLGMLDSYKKSQTPSATIYAFQISASKVGMNPNIKKVR